MVLLQGSTSYNGTPVDTGANGDMFANGVNYGPAPSAQQIQTNWQGPQLGSTGPTQMYGMNGQPVTLTGYVDGGVPSYSYSPGPLQGSTTQNVMPGSANYPLYPQTPQYAPLQGGVQQYAPLQGQIPQNQYPPSGGSGVPLPPPVLPGFPAAGPIPVAPPPFQMNTPGIIPATPIVPTNNPISAGGGGMPPIPNVGGGARPMMPMAGPTGSPNGQPGMGMPNGGGIPLTPGVNNNPNTPSAVYPPSAAQGYPPQPMRGGAPPSGPMGSPGNPLRGGVSMNGPGGGPAPAGGAPSGGANYGGSPPNPIQQAASGALDAAGQAMKPIVDAAGKVLGMQPAQAAEGSEEKPEGESEQVRMPEADKEQPERAIQQALQQSDAAANEAAKIGQQNSQIIYGDPLTKGGALDGVIQLSQKHLEASRKALQDLVDDPKRQAGTLDNTVAKSNNAIRNSYAPILQHAYDTVNALAKLRADAEAQQARITGISTDVAKDLSRMSSLAKYETAQSQAHEALDPAEQQRNKPGFLHGLARAASNVANAAVNADPFNPGVTANAASHSKRFAAALATQTATEETRNTNEINRLSKVSTDATNAIKTIDGNIQSIYKQQAEAAKAVNDTLKQRNSDIHDATSDLINVDKQNLAHSTRAYDDQKGRADYDLNVFKAQVDLEHYRATEAREGREMQSRDFERASKIDANITKQATRDGELNRREHAVQLQEINGDSLRAQRGVQVLAQLHKIWAGDLLHPGMKDSPGAPKTEAEFIDRYTHPEKYAKAKAGK